jgi:hypothetical protein
MIRQSKRSGGSWERSNLAAWNAADTPYVTYAAAFALVGTEAIVFRIWEAIW